MIPVNSVELLAFDLEKLSCNFSSTFFEFRLNNFFNVLQLGLKYNLGLLLRPLTLHLSHSEIANGLTDFRILHSLTEGTLGVLLKDLEHLTIHFHNILLLFKLLFPPMLLAFI